MSEEFDFEKLISKLQNDSESKNTKKLKKLIMNTPDNLGAMITCLPILVKGEIYQKLDAVRELKTTSKFYKDGENETWCRILDKSVYGNLTEEESEIWSRAKNGIEGLIDATGDFYLCRFRKYVLMPVHILKFINANGVEDPEMIGTSLLIFPSHSVIKALKDAFQTMSANANGNQWMPLVLSPKMVGREGYLNIKFSRSASSKGYDTFVSVNMNGQWGKIVDPDKDYTPEEEFDPIREFMSWQAGSDKLFDKEFVKELAESAEKLLAPYKAKAKEESDDASESEDKVSEEPRETKPETPNPTADPATSSAETQQTAPSSAPF